MYQTALFSIFCRGLIVLLLALGGVFGFTNAATAHPLGNFTINHFARLNINPEQVAIQYVVDMAEIPTFQALQTADTDGDRATSDAELNAYLEHVTPRYARGLVLQIDDQAVPLQVRTKIVSLPPGVGGLPTLRLEWELEGSFSHPDPLAIHALRFEDSNERPRIGWREIVVDPSSEAQIFNSSAYSNSLTDALRTYPQDLLTTPLQESVANLSFTQGEVPDDATYLLTRQEHPVTFTRTPLTAVESLKAIVFTPNNQRLPRTAELPWGETSGLVLAIAGAFVWGAMHSLSPGHGKTIVAAYLVGTRATLQHALFLALTTTITHTIGVFALGLITLFAARYILPEQLYPWLSLLSGVMVAVIGCNLLIQRIRKHRAMQSLSEGSHSQDYTHIHAHDHHVHNHDHPHTHSNAHDETSKHAHFHTHSHAGHSHLPPGDDNSPITWRSLLALGISGGLIPCPAALILLLGAIALGNVSVGLILVLAFSLGLASVLITLGLLLVYAKQMFKTIHFNVGLVSVLPAVSALCITLLGLGISARALMDVGMMRLG